MQGEQPQSPPLLEWQRDRWQGEVTAQDGASTLVWMDEATFRRYVEVYLVKRCRQGQPPTWEEKQDAVTKLRDVRYWLRRKIDDPEVHILGRQSPPVKEASHAQ